MNALRASAGSRKRFEGWLFDVGASLMVSLDGGMDALAKESEYAAWTLVNGYALNHTTVSVHRLGSLRNIENLNDFFQENGIKLNSEGGILKVSPDDGLQQSSSVAE